MAANSTGSRPAATSMRPARLSSASPCSPFSSQRSGNCAEPGQQFGRSAVNLEGARKSPDTRPGGIGDQGAGVVGQQREPVMGKRQRRRRLAASRWNADERRPPGPLLDQAGGVNHVLACGHECRIDDEHDRGAEEMCMAPRPELGEGLAFAMVDDKDTAAVDLEHGRSVGLEHPSHMAVGQLALPGQGQVRRPRPGCWFPGSSTRNRVM